MRSLFAAALAAVICSAGSTAARTTFVLPYDLVAARDGSVYFTDRARVLRLEPKSGRVVVYRTVPGAKELTALVRLADGTFLGADLPSGRIVRIPAKGSIATVTTVPDPVDLLVEGAGDAVFVASIAEGVGLVRVDLASGTVEPFAAVDRPHGLDRLPDGDLVVHDGRRVSRVDATTAEVTPFAAVDAFELLAVRSGAVYGVTGGPTGGRVVRMTPSGAVSRIAGTGRLGPHRDGSALRAPMLPSALALARDGSLLVAQIEPLPAIRRVNLATGRISTLALGG